MAHKDSTGIFKWVCLRKLNDLQWAERFIEQAEFITLKRLEIYKSIPFMPQVGS